MLFIDRKIREGMRRGVLANCTAMAAEYEVSTKSILRDIDYLKNQRDAPIAYDPQQRGYYYTEDNFALPAISLNESDLFAICIAEKALKQHEDTPIYRKLQGVFKKIEASLPEKVSIQPQWVESRLSVLPEPQTRFDPETWERISQGLNANHRLQLSYLKPGAHEATERQVDPYHMLRYQGEWYLLGYCHLRAKVLTFAVSRVCSVLVLDQTFELPADFDAEQTGAGQFGIFSGGEEFMVRIRFEAEHVPFVRERQWHPAQHIEECADNGVELSFPARHVYEVKRWILSWGGGVQALAPPELVDGVRAELVAALAQYPDGQGGSQ